MHSTLMILHDFGLMKAISFKLLGGKKLCFQAFFFLKKKDTSNLQIITL